MAESHVPTITLHRAWNEYRADCSCGHVGSYVGTRRAAEQDHARHVQAATSPRAVDSIADTSDERDER